MRGVQERRPAPPLSDRRPGLERLWLALAVALVVVAADQAAKSWAVDRLSHGPIHVVWKLDLALSYNTGSAFGLAQGWAPVLAALAAVVVVGLVVTVRGVRSHLMAVAVGLVVGGAVGNLADRVVRGHHGAVVDFISLHFWPVFNVADSAITVGVILAAALLLVGDRGDGQQAESR